MFVDVYVVDMTDLHGLAEMQFPFELGKPFTPFQQLMGVLPEDSKEHVPSAYRVSSHDASTTPTVLMSVRI